MRLACATESLSRLTGRIRYRSRYLPGRELSPGLERRGFRGRRADPRRDRAPGLLGDMELEKAVGLVALTWLIGSLLLFARLIRRGREISKVLAARYPETYEAAGRPRPGYLYSARRDRFAQFVGRREFDDLEDGALAARFEAYRQSEARLLLSVLASGAVVALIAVAVGHAS